MSTQATAISVTGMSRQQATPGTSNGREPILVVEADADFGRALVEQLAADGHPAELSRTAGHAEMTAGAHPPRLLVLGELDSPRGTLDLLETIRGHDPQASWRQTAPPWPRNLPVIVLSSRRTEPDMLRAFEAGADDFIARPARYLELRGSSQCPLTFHSSLRGRPCLSLWRLTLYRASSCSSAFLLDDSRSECETGWQLGT